MVFDLKRLFILVAFAAVAFAVAGPYYRADHWAWIYWSNQTGWTEYEAPLIWRVSESLFAGILAASACAGIVWSACGVTIADGRSRIGECARRALIVTLTAIAIFILLFVAFFILLFVAALLGME